MSVYHFEQLDNLNLALHFIAELVTGGLKVLNFQRKHKTSKTAKLWFKSHKM